MNNIRLFILAMVIFNGVLVFTEAIGVFDYGGELYQGKNITEVEDVDLTDFTAEDLFKFINPLAGVTSFAIIGIAAGLAWKLHSPSPIAAGASLALYVGLWIQTYGTLKQFPINSILLGLGCVVIAILMIIDIFDIMAGRQ